MSKKYLDLSGLTAYDVRIKAYVSGSTKAVSLDLSNEITRAQQAEQSLYNTYSAITSQHLSGITNARGIVISDDTKLLYSSASNVDDALKYSAPDITLTHYGRSAEAQVTGNRISAVETQINGYTFASAMTEDEYAALTTKDNHTIYFLTED